jgi:hypothetical protein
MSLIRNSKQTKQGIDFTGLQNGKIHPTDIDAVLEFSDKILLLFEMKRKGNTIPRGQELVLERVVDNWTNSDRIAIAIKITHDYKDDDYDVPIELCEAELCYTVRFDENGKRKREWFKPKTSDVKTLLNNIGKRYKEDKLRF